MRSSKRHFSQPGRSALAALLIGLVLLLNVMSACPGLHEWIHQDAGQHGHECAVTLLARGTVDSAVVEVPLAAVPLLLPAPPQFEISVSLTSPEQLPLGRGPPPLPTVS